MRKTVHCGTKRSRSPGVLVMKSLVLPWHLFSHVHVLISRMVRGGELKPNLLHALRTIVQKDWHNK